MTSSDRRNEYTGQHSSLHRSSAVRRTESDRYRGYPESGRTSTDNYRRAVPRINTSTSASASRYRWPFQSGGDDYESPISRRGSTLSTAWNDDRPEHGRTGSVRGHRYPVAEIVPDRLRHGGGAYSAALGYDDPYGNGRESFSSRRRHDQPAPRYEPSSTESSPSSYRSGLSSTAYLISAEYSSDQSKQSVINQAPIQAQTTHEPPILQVSKTSYQELPYFQDLPPQYLLHPEMEGRSSGSNYSKSIVELDPDTMTLTSSPATSALAIDCLATKQLSEADLNQAGKASCAICMKKVPLGSIVKNLPCQHWYHGECIKQWLRRERGSCPLCRDSYGTADVNG
ncbi:hypothetical protein D0868_12336 [Hortaea werneckii]|uniref:RING-type domain-containing protein n=1 Tax=Hortaea werneckii TaxID=91943 RepID=A0A3M6XUD0_HORWE|nr:hypothetical protein D0868_12336 [Hortaea werneckii]